MDFGSLMPWRERPSRTSRLRCPATADHQGREEGRAGGKKGDTTTNMEGRRAAFARSLRLPFEVRDEKVEARCDKRVLTDRAPKPPAAQRVRRRIEVKAA